MLPLLAATLISCTVLRVEDGDTIECDGQLLRMMGDGSPHVKGFDTPELRKYKCDAEGKLAKLARRRLIELLESNEFAIDDSGQLADDGRPLVWIRFADGTTAGEVLLEEGYAVEWFPKYKASWCEKK